jgi:hypothetical protein
MLVVSCAAVFMCAAHEPEAATWAAETQATAPLLQQVPTTGDI